MSDLPTHQSVVEASARLEGHIRKTPILRHKELDRIAGASLFIKAETLQETGSFKLRGATNHLLQLRPDQYSAGVVAYSSGNHAQGVARAARKLGLPAMIVMPSDAPEIKLAGVRADGAELVLYARDTQNREAIAADLSRQSGAVIVPSYDDPKIIAGQGSCGFEFGQQLNEMGQRIDHLICCTGGGGLISGIALGFEALNIPAALWSAEPEGHDDWARSLKSGSVQVNLPGTRSVCDAILTPQPGDLTWQIAGPRLSGGCVVSDEQIFEAMRLAFRHLKLVVEPGGAAALAAALFALPEAARGQRVGLVLTGANIDPALYAEIITSA